MKEDTPLIPIEQPKSKIGVFIGFGGNSQSGNISFNDTNCKCDFDKGRGFGFTIGALYETEIVKRLRWGGAIAYDLRNFWASYREVEQDKFTPDDSNYYIAYIYYRYKSDAVVSYLTFMPYLKYVPAKFMFIRFGLGGSLVLNASLLRTKELIDNKAKLETGEIVDVSLLGIDGNVATIKDEEFPKVNSFQYSFEPAIGFTFPLSEKLAFSPLFQYSIPLSTFSENGKDIKLSAWRIMLELRYDISPEKY